MCARLLRARATSSPGRFDRALERALRRRCCAATSARLAGCCDHRALDAGRHARARVGAHRLPLRHRAEGALPAAGHRHAHRASPRRRRTSRSRRCSERQEAVNAIVAGDPDVAHVVVVHRRRPAAAGNTGTHVRRAASRTPSARRRADEIIARLRPKLARGPGHQRCSCRRCRTCASAAASRARSTSTRSRTPTSTSSATWAPRVLASAAQAARAARRGHRSADRGPRSSTSTIDRDTAARLGHHAAGDRRHALRRVRPAPGRDLVHAAQPVPRGARGRRRSCRRAPTRSTRIYVRARDRRRWCRCPASRSSRSAPTPLSINHQGQFPPTTLSFNLAPGRRAGRGGRRHRRAPSGRSACRRASTPSFTGTAQAFSASLASEPMLILAALLTVYIVLGMLYESLHPPDHDPLDAAVGGRRRAARAAAVHGRASASSRSSASSC